MQVSSLSNPCHIPLFPLLRCSASHCPIASHHQLAPTALICHWVIACGRRDRRCNKKPNGCRPHGAFRLYSTFFFVCLRYFLTSSSICLSRATISHMTRHIFAVSLSPQ